MDLSEAVGVRLQKTDAAPGHSRVHAAQDNGGLGHALAFASALALLLSAVVLLGDSAGISTERGRVPASAGPSAGAPMSHNLESRNYSAIHEPNDLHN